MFLPWLAPDTYRFSFQEGGLAGQYAKCVEREEMFHIKKKKKKIEKKEPEM